MIVPNQLSLFNTESLEVTEEEEIITKRFKVSHRKVKAKGQRKLNLDRLPQEDVFHQLADGKQHCDKCGKKMSVMVERNLISREPKFHPAWFSCENHYAQVYKCVDCDKNAGNDHIVQAPTPQPLFNHSYVSPSVATEFIYSKFVLSVPFYRQVTKWAQYNITLDDRLMARAAIKLSQRLAPLYRLLQAEVQQASAVQIDETPFQVIQGKNEQGYFWTVVTPQEFSTHQVAFFYYSETRAGRTLAKIMPKDYSGAVMCDGYAAYGPKNLPFAQLGSCLVHVVRNFKNLIKAKLDHKSERKVKGGVALQATKFFSAVFRAEKEIIQSGDYTSPLEKAQLRQAKVLPLLDKAYEYLEKESDRSSGKLRKAISYALKQKQRVYLTMTRGELPLSNNHAERQIRPTTIVRKNSLFAFTVAGAQANALYYTLIQTAKLNGLNTYKYLEILLEAARSPETTDWKAYLPWSKMIQTTCLA